MNRKAFAPLALLAFLCQGAYAGERRGVLDGLSEDSRGFTEAGVGAEVRQGALGGAYDGSVSRGGSAGATEASPVDASGTAAWTGAAQTYDGTGASPVNAAAGWTGSPQPLQTRQEPREFPDANWQRGPSLRPVPPPRVRKFRPAPKNVPARSGAEAGLEGAALIMTAFLLLPAASELGARAIGTAAGLAASGDRPALEGPEDFQNDERSLC